MRETRREDIVVTGVLLVFKERCACSSILVLQHRLLIPWTHPHSKSNPAHMSRGFLGGISLLSASGLGLSTLLLTALSFPPAQLPEPVHPACHHSQGRTAVAPSILGLGDTVP